MKVFVKALKTLCSVTSSIYHQLVKVFDELESVESDSFNSDGRILRLSSHKHKAILSTVLKLPLAIAQAYKLENVTKAFVLNGQIDSENKQVPSCHG